MALQSYWIDHVMLSADQGRWREELHRVLHRHGQEHWTLVALLNCGPLEVETPHPDALAGPAGLTLIFQRQV